MKETLKLTPEYQQFAQRLFQRIKTRWKKEKLVIGISGESGSGKSVTGFGLKQAFEGNNFSVSYLQMDDYFHLPPKNNHQNRLKSFKNVGPHEVNLEELSTLIDSFLKDEDSLGRECNYIENKFNQKAINFKGKEVLIVEGTYISKLKNIDVLVFINRNYKETLNNRINRGRESFNPFIEKVLEIEHQIIKKDKNLANIIIDSNYNIEISHA